MAERSTGVTPQPENPEQRPSYVRKATTESASSTESLLRFLSRLSRFGLVAGAPPLLSKVKPGSSS